MTFVRILSALGGVILAIAIVWAIVTADQSFAEAIAWLTSEPWGVVSLIDLYLGFFLIAVLIWVVEPNKAIALLFILPLPVLGNVWAAAWAVWRLAHAIRARRPAGDA